MLIFWVKNGNSWYEFRGPASGHLVSYTTLCDDRHTCFRLEVNSSISNFCRNMCVSDLKGVCLV